MNERSFDDFNEFAGDYRSLHTKNISWSGVDSFYFAQQKVQQVNNFEADNAQRLLDVGCGDGAVDFFFNQAFPSWLLQGIDTSKSSIEEATAKSIRSANFCTYDGVTIPFADQTFDIVFVAAVLHHVNFIHHEVLVKEMYRVLRAGGRLYIFEHNPLNPVTRYLVKTCPFDREAKLLSYGYTKRLLVSTGFKNLRRIFTIFFPRTRFFNWLIPVEKNLAWLPLGGQYFYKAVK